MKARAGTKVRRGGGGATPPKVGVTVPLAVCGWGFGVRNAAPRALPRPGRGGFVGNFCPSHVPVCHGGFLGLGLGRLELAVPAGSKAERTEGDGSLLDPLETNKICPHSEQI